MSMHNLVNRRSVNHRRLAEAKVPAGVRLLKPRFSPTAIFTDQLPPLTSDNGLGIPTFSIPTLGPPTIVIPPVISTPPVVSSAPPVVAPPPVITTSSTPNTVLNTGPLTSSTSSTTALPSTTTTPLQTSSVSNVEATTIVTVPRTVAPALATTSSTSSSASPTASSSSGVSTGAVVGGIGAGIVGVAAVVFAVFFFLRRWRKHDADTWNPDDFRRSAVIMDDPPTHDDNLNRGYNPRPPTMIERKLVSPAPVLATQYDPHPNYGGNYSGYSAADYNSFASYSPGQAMSPPLSANSSEPLFNSPYEQAPYSAASPTSTVGPYGSAYNEHGRLASPGYLGRQPSMGSSVSRQQSVTSSVHLTRQPSAAAAAAYPSMASIGNSMNTDRHGSQYGNYADLHNKSHPDPQIPTSDYVDLSRSSVSPFQAAQYVEISKQLNTDVPAGLPTPAVDEIVAGQMVIPKHDANNDASPFADPEPASVHGQNDLEGQMTPPSPSSSTQDLDFPVPPASMQNTTSSRHRIDSNPPSLPEIRVQPRVSGYDFSSSPRGSPVPSPLGSGFPSGITLGASATASKFPVTPSPLASSFTTIVPPTPVTAEAGRNVFPETPQSQAVDGKFQQQQEQQPIAAAASTATNIGVGARPKIANVGAEKKRPDTVYSTVYDPEDAYGGI